MDAVSTLSALQIQALSLLATGLKIADVAATLSIQPAELKAWMKDDYEFKQEFEFIRAEHREHVTRYILSTIPKAVRTLFEQLDSDFPGIAQGAAKALIEYGGFKKDQLEITEGAGPSLEEVERHRQRVRAEIVAMIKSEQEKK